MRNVSWQAMSACTIAIICVVVLVLFRYEVTGVAAGGEGTNGVAYRLDRWTGAVVAIQGGNLVRTTEKP